MRRTIAALTLAGGLTLVPIAASAQESAPPTSVVTSEVERTVPVVSSANQKVPTNSVVQGTFDKDDDDGGPWWIGLFGLLGLLGLAGLVKRRDHNTLGPPTGSVRADTTPRGSTPND